MSTLTDIVQWLLARLLLATLLLLLVHRDNLPVVAGLSPSQTVGGRKLVFGECAGTGRTSNSPDSEPRSHTEAGASPQRCRNTEIKEVKKKMDERCTAGNAGEQNVF